MKIYLAGYKTIEQHYTKNPNDVYLLSSFWEHKAGKFGEYVYSKKHILDSGAFSTFRNPDKAKQFDWNTYVRQYIKFIRLTKQQLFFELDIDIVIGLSKVEYYRKQIEDAIGIAPIVCWHANRGADYWLKCCEEYKYVAIGTTKANNEGALIRKNPAILNWFISTAHSKGAKIHGLGFTSIPWLPKLKFDSVDSTTWLNGGKYGEMHQFNGSRIVKVHKKNYSIADYKRANLHNFDQWTMYQKYAEQKFR